MTVVGSILLGLVVALMLNKEFKGRAIVRRLCCCHITPLISNCLLLKYIFDPSYGPFMQLFSQTLGWVPPQLDLLNNSNNAFLVASVFNLAKLSFVYLMLLSRLQSIPDDYYEAAEIDGATSWKQFTNITLPELYFVMGVALMRGI